MTNLAHEHDSKDSSHTLRAVRGCATTNKGPVRQENQDSLLIIENDDFRLYAVADGMGGAQAGAQASQIMISVLREVFTENRKVTHIEIVSALKEANRLILEESARLETRRGMGTTIAVLVCTQDGFFVANVGDSRIYCLRSNQICKLTEDHTVVAQLLKAGTLTRDQAEKTPFSNILTSFIGFSQGLEVDCWKSGEGLYAGDRFIICSDGLHSTLQDSEISAVAQQGSIEEAAQALVDAALKAGTNDNITVIVIEVGEGFPTIATRTRPPTLRSATDDTKEVAIGPNRLSGIKATIPFALRPAFLASAIIFVSFGFVIAKIPEFLLQAPTTSAIEGNVISTFSSDLNQDLAQGTEDSPPNQPSPISLDTSLETLQESLDKVRTKIDVETRRIALWYRREQILRRGDTLKLAAEVGLSAPNVRQLKERFDHVHMSYLTEAEDLIYNPADLQRERKVNQLSNERKKLVVDLKNEIERVVRTSLISALTSLTDLSRQRDRLEAAVQAKKSSLNSNQ